MIHDEIAEVLKRWVVFRGVAPGASACVASFREGGWRVASGAAGVHSSSDTRPVVPETIYDLASLTKPVIAALTARLVRSGAFGWRDPLGSLLEAARGTASEAAPLELLASHRAGLEAHLRLGAGAQGPSPEARGWLRSCANARRAECRTELPAEGFAPVYSDLGYILLGSALTSADAAGLEASLEREVSVPCGLELLSAASFCERIGSAAFLARVAPTELVPARGGELRGVVHDDNAWELTGSGLSGHAGLFGTARAVAGFGMTMLDALSGSNPDWLTRAEAELLVRPRPGGSLRAGFDGKAAANSAAGPCFGPRAFGHLGFTGTSVWCDPEAMVVVVFLTNRVSPSRDNILIRDVRPDVHGELFGLAAGL